MKKYIIKTLVTFLLLALVLPSCVYAQPIDFADNDVTISQFPDGYTVYYGENLKGFLAQFYGSSDKIPDYDRNCLKILALTKSGSQIKFYIEKLNVTDDEGKETSLFLRDYNIYDDLNLFVDGEQKALAQKGAVVQTVEPLTLEGSPTPYVMSVSSMQSVYITRLVTVYKSNSVFFEIIDNANPTAESLEEYKNIAKSIDYGSDIDYTQTKEYLAKIEADKNEAENKENQEVEESSDIIFWIVVVVVIGVLVFAVYLATRKRKKSVLKNEQ